MPEHPANYGNSSGNMPELPANYGNNSGNMPEYPANAGEQLLQHAKTGSEEFV
jgi:hypothetical protein